MKLRIEVPINCILGDSEEREELIDLMGCWGLYPEHYDVIHVGSNVIEPRCYVDVDTEAASNAPE